MICGGRRGRMRGRHFWGMGRVLWVKNSVGEVYRYTLQREGSTLYGRGGKMGEEREG